MIEGLSVYVEFYKCVGEVVQTVNARKIMDAIVMFSANASLIKSSLSVITAIALLRIEANI